MKLNCNCLKYICHYTTIAILLLCTHAKGGIKNSGAIITTGSNTHLKIAGFYQHTANGRLINDGTIHLSGDWINNDSYTGDADINYSGELYITGNSTLSGNGGKEAFEDITIKSGTEFKVSPGITCHLYGDIIREDYTSTFKLDNSSAAHGCLYTEGDITDTISINLFLPGNRWTFTTIPFEGYTPSTLLNDALDNSIGIACFDEQKRATQMEDWEWCNANDILIPGKGYIFWSNNDTTIVIKGVLKLNRTINLEYSDTENGYWHNGWNLVGNYTPTPIDLFKTNSEDRPDRINVDAAIYVYNRETNDYWTFVDGLGINMPPDGSKIAPYQAFFMKSNDSSAQVSFKGVERIIDNSIVLRSASIADETIRLTLKDNSGESQAIIRYKEEATAKFDSNFDAYQINTSKSLPIIYTFSKEAKLVVNSLPNHYIEEIPLGIYTNSPESFKISWEMSNLNEASLYLLDKSTNQIFLMDELSNNMTFDSDTKEIDNRFIILRVNKNTTLVNHNKTSKITLSQTNSHLEISSNEVIKAVTVHSIDGKMLFSQRLNNTEITLNTSQYKGIVLFKVDFSNFTHTFKRIFY